MASHHNFVGTVGTIINEKNCGIRQAGMKEIVQERNDVIKRSDISTK